MKYYHITKHDRETIQSIKTNGLICNNDGRIYLFEDISMKHNVTGVVNSIADLIANDQIFLRRYAMFEINSNGLTGELHADDVAEFGAKAQWYVKQAKIEPNFITLMGIYKNKFKPFY